MGSSASFFCTVGCICFTIGAALGTTTSASTQPLHTAFFSLHSYTSKCLEFELLDCCFFDIKNEFEHDFCCFFQFKDVVMKRKR